MRTPILLSATRAAHYYRPLTLPKSHHHHASLFKALTLHPHQLRLTSSTTTNPPLDLPPSNLHYNKTLNPPPTTRPPPFSIPPSNPSLSLLRNLFTKGKAIVTFYKTGLKSILLNRRLHSTPLDSLPPNIQPLKPHPDTRAALLLRSRLSHDLGRLIPLSLILLICAELTPVVILAAPNLKLTPLTCRMPRELEAIRKRDGEIRKQMREMARNQRKGEGEGLDAAVGEILRVGRPMLIPSWLYPTAARKSKLDRRLAWILADDAMIVQGGGEEELVGEEVKLAVEERGVDVLGKGEEELRGLLRRWLDIASKVEDLDERREVIKEMIITGEDGWGKWEEGREKEGVASV
ncbi:hypothetical protein QBC41DRAFT_342864 [Cercophora samala]|uniref:Letm1 RBD domain-containing protein n=1 Tax=Cercophora samala TaxID=330535 RepID=A0AA39ZM56_9PEZI|nr:hypothetical protein QBC41DRAFT_342864 [Cercophora samala]